LLSLIPAGIGDLLIFTRWYQNVILLTELIDRRMAAPSLTNYRATCWFVCMVFAHYYLALIPETMKYHGDHEYFLAQTIDEIRQILRLNFLRVGSDSCELFGDKKVGYLGQGIVKKEFLRCRWRTKLPKVTILKDKANSARGIK